MIVLSVGMPRAGSGWYYNLTNSIMLASGAQDAHTIRQRFHLESVLSEVNCNIGALTPRRLLLVAIPALMGNSFVIKAHAGPTPLANSLMRIGLIRTTYIYRDPRDAMLSAYENGQRARKAGRTNAFSPLVDFESALNFILEYLQIWEAWASRQGVLHSRYESLLENYDMETKRLCTFLNVNKEHRDLQPIIERYRPGTVTTNGIGLHFSKGVVGRFRLYWSEEQQKKLQTVLRPYLVHMGYE
jgi:hypothetical protein